MVHYEVEYDARLETYVLHYAGEIFILDGSTDQEARTQAKIIVEQIEDHYYEKA